MPDSTHDVDIGGLPKVVHLHDFDGNNNVWFDYKGDEYVFTGTIIYKPTGQLFFAEELPTEIVELLKSVVPKVAKDK